MLFPILFVTVACGACSGFHSLVSSGTTSKQMASERHILPIGYGAMLVEGLLAMMALISVVYLPRAEMGAVIAEKGPVAAFAAGLAHFCESFHLDPEVGGNFFTLAISAFLLTTLDTATRLARFAWQEMFLPRGGERAESAPVVRALSNRYAATLIVIVLSGYLAYSANYRTIWPVFGASNQLLAALTLLVVTLILAKRRANFWVALFPMLFMMVICVWALLLLLKTNWGVNWALVAATAFLLVLSALLAVQSVLSLRRIQAEEAV
jgi:carbon starvation protein